MKIFNGEFFPNYGSSLTRKFMASLKYGKASYLYNIICCKTSGKTRLFQYVITDINLFKANIPYSLNYSWSRINAWSRLVTGGNSIITKIKARSQINAGSFVGPQ